MNSKRQSQLEKLLLSTLVLYRYEEEVRVLEKEVASQNKDPNEKTTFKKAMQDIASKISKVKEDPAETLEKAKRNLEEYKKGLDPEVNLALGQDEDALIDEVNHYFDRDNSSKRLAMGLELGLLEASSDLPALLRPDASRKALSRVLFADEELLGKLLEVYVYCFRRISGEKMLTPKSSQDLGAKLGAVGAGIALLGLLTGPGVLLLGQAIGLSGLGMYLHGKHQEKKGEKADDSLLLFSSFILGSDIDKRRFGRRAAKRLRKAGQEASAKGYVFALASAIAIYNFRFEDKTTDLAKEAMSRLLERIDAIRSDAEYLALVERENMEENHKKMVAASRASELLYDIVYKNASQEEIVVEVVDEPLFA